MNKSGVLYVAVGLPGSGKSTYIESLCEGKEDMLHVSRDKIRFSMLAPGEDYFCKERAVFKEFVRQINMGLAAGKTVFADATHINQKSRAKLLKAIAAPRFLTLALIFNTPLETCLERNSKREGLSLVPENVIKNMFYNSENVTLSEGFNGRFEVNEKNECILIHRRS